MPNRFAITAYKHLRSIDLKFYTTKASFRLSTLSSLRSREDLIALYDPMEGLSATKAQNEIVTNGRDPVFDRMIFIKGSLQIIGDITFIDQVPDCWVWCTTNVQSIGLAEGYDTVLQITDLYRLAKRLQEASSGRLGDPTVSTVSYSPRERAFGAGGTVASAWVKDVRFSHENEIRVCWPFTQIETDNEINIESWSALKLLRLNGRPLARL